MKYHHKTANFSVEHPPDWRVLSEKERRLDPHRTPDEAGAPVRVGLHHARWHVAGVRRAKVRCGAGDLQTARPRAHHGRCRLERPRSGGRSGRQRRAGAKAHPLCPTRGPLRRPCALPRCQRARRHPTRITSGSSTPCASTRASAPPSRPRRRPANEAPGEDRERRDDEPAGAVTPRTAPRRAAPARKPRTRSPSPISAQASPRLCAAQSARASATGPYDFRRRALWAVIGRRKPLRVSSPTGSASTRSSTRASRRCGTRIWPGLASPQSRAARLVTVPIAP